ncbi:gamma-glutamyltransferase [Metaclostridioides mangenotii]|uniref:gamma-glutamyltransferase n=1 Tax=Metaclostridioides mangenotii TaxID=1540 RepID=UPI0028E31EBC|nr:gamma-glutamyltransferase [Clostridioides mangenotii]
MKFDVENHVYNSKRNVVFGKSGAVATSVPLSSQVGLEILKMGGNAVDAAVATAAASAVVEPVNNGIGGDAYALVWIEEEKKLYGLNSSGFAPEKMTLESFNGLDEMPKYGLKPVTVPGIPAAWAELNKKFGNLTLMDCLKPAINYAREGFVVSPTVAKIWEKDYKFYKKVFKGEEFAPWFDTFSKNGRAPLAGEIFKCEDQAKTLEEIAKTNAESFYRGSIAEKIDAFSKKYDGFIRKSDLEKFYPEWVEPITTDYRGYTVSEIPPNGHGLTVLMALNILKGFDLNGYREDSDNLHKTIESLKLAFADTKTYITDIKHMKVKLEALLNQSYADKRRELIKDKAIQPESGDPYCGGTVYLCSADKDGNMVSYIQSNYMDFGSGIVIPETGIALHNRGNNFSLDPEHHNVVAPLKKPYHTIIPGFLSKDSEAVGAFGVMGKFMQPQGHIQVLSNMIDFGLNPQDALDAPRWQWIKDKEIEVEHEMPKHTVYDLAKKGHDVKVIYNNLDMGRGQIIIKNEHGSYACGTESRCDGCVAVY